MARIVVADDDDDIRELVEFKLTTLGHDVVPCVDGAAALAACAEHVPDLILLDVTMPGMSGLEALAVIRSDSELAELPVVMLTARAQEGDIHAGLSRGATDYVTKPFSPRELAARIEELLGTAAP
ncbi:MAG: response regulator transcription factor [Nocardioides sp.]